MKTPLLLKQWNLFTAILPLPDSMPIVIKELHIRVTLNNPENAASQASRQHIQPTAGENDGVNKDAIVAECVEQVLHILKEKTER